MARKIELITDLYTEAVKEVSETPENWMAFLRSSCRNYRLPFDEQLLIHKQRPDATAVLSMGGWNKKFGRWVKRGSKGIAVFDKRAGAMRVKYYFDISDTEEGRDLSLLRPIPLWEVERRHREEVKETLANSFGIQWSKKKNFEEVILESTSNAASDHLEDYLTDIMANCEGSSLDGMDDLSVRVMVRTLLANSAAYTVMLRCGADVDSYIAPFDFRHILNINTFTLVNLFGSASSDISGLVLAEVGDTVRKAWLREQQEKRTFAGRQDKQYNEKEKSQMESTERGTLYEDENNRIQQAGGLSPSGPDRAGRTGNTPWEIRLPPTEISGGGALRNLHQPADAGETEPTPERNAGRGTGNDGAPDGGHEEGAGRDGGTEREEPDGVAGDGEQHPAVGGGDRPERADIQLEWHDRSSEDKSIPFFGKDEDIKSLLLLSPHLKATKAEIRAFYETHREKRERTEYIQGIFNHEPTEVTLGDGRGAGYKTYRNVLHIWEGAYGSPTAQAYYDWRVIADYFEGMRLLGELKDRSERLPTVEGQLSLIQEKAGDETSAFSFTQEIVDHALCNSCIVEHGKYRIYAYFLQNHTAKEKAQFLKKEYGVGGHAPLITGTGIREDHNGKGIHLARGYDDGAPKILVTWKQAAKRIDELIANGRYMSEHELAGIPEYEKHELAVSIYRFYAQQPESVVHPYPYGAEYADAMKIIGTQLADTGQTEDMLESMREVLDNTADFDKNYGFMKKTVQDLSDYLNGCYSLFLPIPAEEERLSFMEPEHPRSREEVLAWKISDFYYDSDIYADLESMEDVRKRVEEQLLAPEEIGTVREYLELAVEETDSEDKEYPMLRELLEEVLELPAMHAPYDLQTDTAVYIGMDKYEIQFLSDEAAVLRDMRYPLFTKEMPRDELEQKLRENPANDHLKKSVQTQEAKGREGKKNSEEGINTGSKEESGKPGGKSKKGGEKGGEERERHAEDKAGQEEDAEKIIPEWEKLPPAPGFKPLNLHPEIPKAEKNQFRITDDELGQGTAKEKFRANIAAIQMLKKCEEEGRLATPDEQEWLAKYVGWGGLSDAFDETKSAWAMEYLELKTVLTDEEYSAARQSTLTAFYTPPVVIRAIYQALEGMGLKTGNILEPSCAVGNFIGMKPESLAGCRIYGVELDSISGRIARQLYQQSDIAVQGFEEVSLPDSFFDVAVGNVPFGQFKVSDKRYDKHNFLIHDYFFAKALDKVRPGGVIAFITSSGTMDKKNFYVRRYIAQRAELLGAVRLPNDTFKKNAGTEVTADILFLQKRERLAETEPDWLYLGTDENGITQNNYFISHPEMVLGEMVSEQTRYGLDSVCRPYETGSLEEHLKEAVAHIQAEITEYESSGLVEEAIQTIPADPSIANFSYAVVEGQVYYRENSRMKHVETSVTGANRIKGMIAIRDCVRELIAYQTDGYPDTYIEKKQKELNRLYDVFQMKYGLLNARANSMVFSDDGSYPLLCSLEVVAEDGTLKRKADMFTKRTIKPHETVRKADTASEALSISLSEKACVDMGYMCSLTGKGAEEIEQELKGVIFRMPDVQESHKPIYVSGDEYLSGNVREKLKQAEIAAQSSEVYQSNVEALKRVQPKDLPATEISVRIGATWIPETDVQAFIFQLLGTSDYARMHIKVHFSKHTGEWSIEGKGRDRANVKAGKTYGTYRANAYRIIEDSLNLRDTRIYDYVEDEEGRKKPILNKKETAIAQGKQDLIKQEFKDWIWKEPERRQRLVLLYNEKFNAVRPREYDGSHLKFCGMNPEIKLRQHQINGAARIIYGGNTLLAYVVGAGKTYTMVAAAMESKRLGLCSKSMVVVPNHIIEQFAAEWMQLYPAANLLVATKKDFEAKNRKKFCARIATSDIDAVIIGHSQFEKIPLSVERQERMLERQIEEVMEGIAEAKSRQGERFTVKQLEKSRKSLEARLKKLNDQSRKDDVVCFEELGVDRLFVDEADSYKNLCLYTKMRNVGGISQTEAQKSSDMFMKCRYLDGLTGGRGVVFATGTPVSNSMTELYTMQRYLQYPALEGRNLQHFDAWASTFGETVTAIELAPEGSGYRLKTRFAKFYNLPELMQMFREVADIQTADMLKLPVPEAEYRVVSVKPSRIQKGMVEELGKRAEEVRDGTVGPCQDNMLLITNDGRKLALDQRLMNELLPDEEGSKVNACVREVFRYWEQGKEEKLTQLVFCDLSVPKNDGTFSVYNDVRDKLIAKGIPPQEIEFIHDANTEVKKKELFSKVRRGAVRILMGSTFKMGAGTNVQNLIIASHDLDCPWRPRDLEQRAGRTIRQGNRNKKVDIVRYVTEGTFDAYLYQMIENKQKFISQIMTSKSPARTIEDVDEAVLSYAEIKALAAGNPHIKEKMNLDIEVSKLQLLKQSFLSQRYEMEDRVLRTYPEEIRNLEKKIAGYCKDIAIVKENTPSDRDVFPPMKIGDVVYDDKKEAGNAIIAACKAMLSTESVTVGSYRGLVMELSYSTYGREFVITLKGILKHQVALGTDIYGNVTRLDNKIAQFEDNLARCGEELENTKNQLETAKNEISKPFPKEDELAEKTERLGELNRLLDLDKKEDALLEDELDEMENESGRERKERER